MERARSRATTTGTTAAVPETVATRMRWPRITQTLGGWDHGEDLTATGWLWHILAFPPPRRRSPTRVPSPVRRDSFLLDAGRLERPSPHSSTISAPCRQDSRGPREGGGLNGGGLNPMIPHTFVLEPRLRMFNIYNGYWYSGRPTMRELHADLPALLQRSARVLIRVHQASRGLGSRRTRDVSCRHVR